MENEEVPQNGEEIEQFPEMEEVLREEEEKDFISEEEQKIQELDFV